jgi:hypothetical protein
MVTREERTDGDEREMGMDSPRAKVDRSAGLARKGFTALANVARISHPDSGMILLVHTYILFVLLYVKCVHYE